MIKNHTYILILFAGLLLLCTNSRAQSALTTTMNRNETDIPNPFVPKLPIETPLEDIPKPLPSQPIVNKNAQEEKQFTEKKKIEPPQNSKKTAPEKETAPNLTITGIIWDTDKPQAIINDRVVTIGSTFFESNNAREIKILKIHKTGIEISCNNKIWTITP
ncbi:MAG: hypothetical protein HQL24_10450 [Candidatus Omnitrophica bacterium]|nr:hypothetical protein [Candidatus Omnitrophota bacterium]